MLLTLLSRLEFAAAAALLLLGASLAMVSANIVKRVVGVLMALLAALLGLSLLGAPAALLFVGAACAGAVMMLGAALIVRLQETYNSVEAGDLDAADAERDAAEPGA